MKLFNSLLFPAREEEYILKTQRDIALIVSDQGPLEERIGRVLGLLIRYSLSAAAYFNLGREGTFTMAASAGIPGGIPEEISEEMKTISSDILYSELLSTGTAGRIRFKDQQVPRGFSWARAAKIAGWNWALLLPVKSGRRLLGLLAVVSRKRRGVSKRYGYLLEIAATEFGEMILRFQAEEGGTRYLQELERSNQELEEFAYVVSHDLQEPLRTIRNFIQLTEARYGDKLDEKGKSYIQRVVKGAERMSVMIDDLLGYSRVLRKGEDFSPRDLNLLLDTALENLNLTIKKSGAVIERGVLPILYVDANQIVRVFQNLVSNAIKYVSPEKTPRITLGAEERGECWEITVKDNGIGIAEDYYEEIFGVFTRLHGRDEYSGTGIGLAICRRIINRHKGEIRVRSVEGEGSVFSFTLPKYPVGERRTGDSSHVFE